MNDKDRNALELNDLEILHTCFDKDEHPNARRKEDIEYPYLTGSMGGDLWSEILHEIDSNNTDRYRSLLARVKNSNMSVEGKRWWIAILNILMEAPPEELAMLFGRRVSVPNRLDGDSIISASQIAAKLAYEREKRRRAENARKAREIISELKKDIEKRECERAEAVENLNRHYGRTST